MNLLITIPECSTTLLWIRMENETTSPSVPYFPIFYYHATAGSIDVIPCRPLCRTLWDHCSVGHCVALRVLRLLSILAWASKLNDHNPHTLRFSPHR